MSMGETIKKIRRSHDMTQEQLAEYLNISAQAVSRWETNQAMPDITLLPAIANLFDVTIDELFEMNEIRNREYRNDIFSRAHALIADNKYDEAVEVYREALKTLPKDYGIMSDLALVLSLSDISTDTGVANAREAIRLCERVLMNSTSDKLRSTTRVDICFLYYALGECQKAEDECRKLPHFWESREIVLPELLEKEKANGYLKDTICSIFMLLYEKIDTIRLGSGGMKKYIAVGPSPVNDNKRIVKDTLTKIIEFMGWND